MSKIAIDEFLKDVQVINKHTVGSETTVNQEVWAILQKYGVHLRLADKESVLQVLPESAGKEIKDA
jgi:hypothetical protein